MILISIDLEAKKDFLLVVCFMRSNAVLFMAHLGPGYRGLPRITLREQSLFIHTTLIVGSLAPRQATAWPPGSTIQLGG